MKRDQPPKVVKSSESRTKPSSEQVPKLIHEIESLLARVQEKVANLKGSADIKTRTAGTQ